MNRSPITKGEETNRFNPEVAAKTSKRESTARKLVDYTQQRGEGETHIQEKQACYTTGSNKKTSRSSSSTRRLQLVQPDIPAEIVLDKAKSKKLNAEEHGEEEAVDANQQQQEGEEMVDFLLRIPAASKHPRQPDDQLRSSFDDLNDSSQGSLKAILSELGYTKHNNETRKKKRRDKSLFSKAEL